jgi:hypothetical protein
MKRVTDGGNPVQDQALPGALDGGRPRVEGWQEEHLHVGRLNGHCPGAAGGRVRRHRAGPRTAATPVAIVSCGATGSVHAGGFYRAAALYVYERQQACTAPCTAR